VPFGFRDQVMVGTMHVPSGGSSVRRDRIALVLLNAGPAPRAGNSDLSAYLADRLAARGVPSFRFDFPGLGDSTGPSWRDIDLFWHASQRGFNDAAVIELVNDLCLRHELRGVLLGGLCAGAIASVRAAQSLGTRVLGLVLLEPNFRASADVDAVSSAPTQDAATAAVLARPHIQRIRRAMSRLTDIDEALYLLTGSSKRTWAFRPIRPLLERIIERRLGRELPGDVLMEQVHAWRHLVNEGLPSVVVLAKGLGTDRYMERIVGTLPLAGGNVVRTVLIPDTNHILTAGAARRSTAEALCAWVAELFPEAMVRAQAGPETRLVASFMIR
jgi:pimeloyl-ACP methyl ester carboxylesterase